MKFSISLFLELRELGYNDLIIADKFGIKPESLLRQLVRYGIDADRLLIEESHRRKAAVEARRRNRAVAS